MYEYFSPDDYILLEGIQERSYKILREACLVNNIDVIKYIIYESQYTLDYMKLESLLCDLAKVIINLMSTTVTENYITVLIDEYCKLVKAIDDSTITDDCISISKLLIDKYCEVGGNFIPHPLYSKYINYKISERRDYFG